MLSPETLNRVSSSYRRGYYDGHDLKPAANLAVADYRGIPLKPFSDFDYDEGYGAGKNDRYWNDFFAKKTTLTKAEFMAAVQS
jgi:hypothetical protein